MPKKNGFTLIELLVVVAIISILSVIGFVVFGNVTNNARDARRKSDIDAIANSYEANYKPQTGYRALVAGDFTGGRCPVPPEGGEYVWIKAPGPGTTARGFLVCAKLEGYSGNCPASGADIDKCYCKSSSLEETTDTIPSPTSGCTSTAVATTPPPPGGTTPPPLLPPPASQPPPTLVTKPATEVTQISVKLNGAITYSGPTKYWFQYGAGSGDCSSLSSLTAKQNADSPSPTTNSGYFEYVSGLLADTTYRFCIAASNSAGVYYGDILTFKTLPVLALIPPSSSYKRIFVTSKTYNGNLGGLGGADAKCQDRANAASLGGTWTAWLSDSKAAAKDRITHINTGPDGYRLLDGTVIALDWNDLTDGTIKNKPNRDENRKDIELAGSGRVWTNTRSNGSPQYGLPLQICNDWSLNSGGSPTSVRFTGNPFRTDSVWTDNLDLAYGCGNLRRLYCFEQ